MKTHQVTVIVLVFLMLFTIFSNFSLNAKASYDLSKVAYYDRVEQAFNLTAKQESMLQQHGFVVTEIPNLTNLTSTTDRRSNIPWMRFEDFYYLQIYNPDLPVFVTTDSMLHLFHVVFDCSLRMTEERVLYSMISEVTQYAFNKAVGDYNSISHDGTVKYWAIRNATVYFGVAQSLISGVSVTLPNELRADLNFYLNEIYAREPRFVYAGILKTPDDDIILQYDFTQFTVRGHYLGVPKLEQYFRTLMWYGNFPVFIPRSDETYSWSVSHIDDQASVYVRDIFKQDSRYFDEWMMVYNVTSALVGESDSINPLNLEVVLHKVFGDKSQYLDLVAATGGLAALRAELAKPAYEQQILGQALVAGGNVPLRYPIVFQFMGQRNVPDSCMFQMLCWDKTGPNSLLERRILPKGLDVFAVLGSNRAYELLAPDFGYTGYTSNLATLTSKFNNLTEEEWTRSSYTAWVHSLQSLTNVQYNSSYPDFMRDLAWKDEKLNTALGSWAQLRHDTLLYAKQTYIGGILCSYPEAFVEPNPEFYSRMQQLCQRTIDAINILPSGSVNQVISNSLAMLKNTTQRFQVISTKELARQSLTTEETDFIKQIVWAVNGCGLTPTGWYYNTITDIAMAANYTSLLNVPVIADVATFPPGDIAYPPQILHVGVGYVNGLIVVYPTNNGTLVAAVGPVFSYYEFPLVGTKRLNDNEWNTMLTWNNRTAYLPSWVQDVYAMSVPIAPEYTTVAVLTTVMLIVTVVLIKLGRTKKIHFQRNVTK